VTDRQTNKLTDGQTEFLSLYRVCITCSAVKQGLCISAIDAVFKAIFLNKIMYALPVYFGYVTEFQRNMLQRVLHRDSSRGFTPYYCDLDTLAENAHYYLLRHNCRQAHCLNHLYTVKPGHLAPCSWEPVVISLNCLLLNMNSTNETLSFDRFLIMYNLRFQCIIVIFVFHCTHVRMSCVKLWLT